MPTGPKASVVKGRMEEGEGEKFIWVRADSHTQRQDGQCLKRKDVDPEGHGSRKNNAERGAPKTRAVGVIVISVDSHCLSSESLR